MPVVTEPAQSAAGVALAVALPVVAVGGAAGALGRHALTELAGSASGTLVVNLLGCLLLGVLVGARPDDAVLRLGLGTGVLGGFTTMSTFAADTLGLPPDRAAGYLLASVGGGLLMAHAGLVLGRARARPGRPGTLPEGPA